MDDATNAPTWERLAPIYGVTFVLVDFVVAVLSGEPPATGAAPASITEYYVEHAQGVQAGLWLFGLGVIALIFWSAGLWRWMVQVARLIADDHPDAAIAELEAAYQAFDTAGARRGADQAAALLRTLGGQPKTDPKRRNTLTPREEEVLDLLATGLTNAEIAERLFISPKTVEHHVGRVLAKLGLRNRAEAAAHTHRGGTGGTTR